MPKFSVKQPNGLYAVFSTIVDDFTYVDQTRDEALEYWRDVCGLDCAKRKVHNADTEDALGYPWPDSRPLARWRDCFGTISGCGPSDAETVMALVCTDPEWLKWAKEVRTVWVGDGGTTHMPEWQPGYSGANEGEGHE